MAEVGQKVAVSYVGTFDDGEVFDSTESHGGEPLEFVVGDGRMISGFDKAVRGMKVGETCTVALEPADAYGEHNPQLVRDFKRKDLGELGEQLAGLVGQSVMLQGPEGMQEVTVKAADADSVTLDFNSRMAGKRLHFEITLLSAE